MMVPVGLLALTLVGLFVVFIVVRRARRKALRQRLMAELLPGAWLS